MTTPTRPASPNTLQPVTVDAWQRRAVECANNPNSRNMSDYFSQNPAAYYHQQQPESPNTLQTFIRNGGLRSLIAWESNPNSQNIRDCHSLTEALSRIIQNSQQHASQSQAAYPSQKQPASPSTKALQRFAKPPSLLETLKAWNGMKNPEERDRQQLRVLISWQEQAASRHRQDIAALPFQAAYHQQQPASPNTPHPDTGNEWQRRAKEWANNPDSRKMFDCVSYHEAINHFNQLSQQGSSQNQAAYHHQ